MIKKRFDNNRNDRRENRIKRDFRDRKAERPRPPPAEKKEEG